MDASPQTVPVNRLSTLSQRLVVVLVILPAGLAAIVAGGWVLTLVVAVILARAGWEYWRMYRTGGYRPSALLLAGGTALLALTRHLTGFELTGLLFSLLMLANMALQVVNYQTNKDTATLDFNINLGGVIYIGWLGSYLVSLRDLPGGLVWLLLVLPATWFADAAAYLVGSRIGKHKLAPHISPKKSWEGYIGGVVLGTLGTVLMATVWNRFNPLVGLDQALVIGLLVSILSPLGDLCESLLKRSFGLKDTSNLMPGHGGMLDRIDSWLWAAPLGYYIITLLFR
jgi:phosphatidate cytidylyltransferase